MSYTVKNIAEFSQIMELISDQPCDANGRYRGTYLYRGLPNKEFHLLTSLQRNCGSKSKILESKLLDNFAKYTSGEIEIDSNNIWQRMILGQHHGLPTRLLDWTHSPLVALNFATIENLATLDQNDCVIWRIDAADFYSQSPKSTHVLSVDMLTDVANSLEEYDSKMGDSSMVIMEPPSIDARIINQYAFFSVIPSGVTDIEDFLDKHTTNTVKYVIDKSLKWRLRDFLDEANISERTIYPGLDGICKWIARHYFVKE